MEELPGWGHPSSHYDKPMSAPGEMKRALAQRHPGLETFKRDARRGSHPIQKQDNDIKTFVVNRTTIPDAPSLLRQERANFPSSSQMGPLL